MRALPELDTRGAVLRTEDLTVHFGGTLRLFDVTVAFPDRAVTALIGPAGSGKSTLLRACNRLVELVDGASIEGSVWFGEQDVYARDVDPVAVRRAIGLVFEKPNPFPKSVFDNVAYTVRQRGIRRDIEPFVERALIDAGLWNEVRDDLYRPALELSLGQQQRLCLARALAAEPAVLLLDDPSSAMDPVATRALEDRLRALAEQRTVVLVTHDLRQAARVSDATACLTAVELDDGGRFGVLAEFGETAQVLTDPVDPRTRAFLSGSR